MNSCLALPVLVTIAVFVHTAGAEAHCDALDGPVVSAARSALESGDSNPVVIWVEESEEAGIRAALARARAVRILSPEAKELADTWFFETIVRVHRAGEGEPFTGLRPAGQVEPAIAAADRAVATGSLAPLRAFVPAEHLATFEEALAKVLSLKSFRRDDVEAGRTYVAAYVRFLHLLEHLPASGPAAKPKGTEMPEGPKPLADEHAELHERLAEAFKAGGETAEKARVLARALHPHFVREQGIVMPLLSLLPRLSRGEADASMRPAIETARALAKDLPRMLEEHKGIKAGAQALGKAAEREGHERIARFSKRLVTHAEIEEAVLYPGALLVGRWLEEHLPR